MCKPGFRRTGRALKETYYQVTWLVWISLLDFISGIIFKFFWVYSQTNKTAFSKAELGPSTYTYRCFGELKWRIYNGMFTWLCNKRFRVHSAGVPCVALGCVMTMDLCTVGTAVFSVLHSILAGKLCNFSNWPQFTLGGSWSKMFRFFLFCGNAV